MKCLDENERLALALRIASGELEICYARVEESGHTYCTV